MSQMVLTFLTAGGFLLVALTLPMLTGCAGHRDAPPGEVALIARHLALAPGAAVADIGAGAGGYALALARHMGSEARVLATEIDAGKAATIGRRAAAAGLDNVEVIEADADSTGLLPGCCDAAFMRGVYHHLTDPGPTLDGIFRALRPGGRLLVIDFPPSFWLKPWTPSGLPADRAGHGIAAEIVEAEARQAGFVVEQRLDDWPSGWFTDLYGLVLRKPG